MICMAAADGSVVLNLHRGAGAYALLARTDGQLTRAGQHSRCATCSSVSPAECRVMAPPM